MNAAFAAGRRIPVLLVDDSPIALAILGRMLAGAPEIEVAGTARNGREALDRLPHLAPDVICTDLHMPVMDGLEFTRAVMARDPRPILVVSVSVQEHQTHNIFELLEAGAVDVFAKPRTGNEADYQARAAELASKIRILSGVHVFRRNRQHPAPAVPPAALAGGAATGRVVALGASTGGPVALRAVLSQLPEGFPAPLLCVQHIGEIFLEGFVSWLAAQCRLKVEIAQDGAPPLPGRAYFARPDTHLELDGAGRLQCTGAPPREGMRPSINVTFEAVARCFGAGAVGVLLTGMGSDGALGLKAIAEAGGATVAQDEATSVVFGMARAAQEIGAVQHLLPLEAIAPALVTLTARTGAVAS